VTATGSQSGAHRTVPLFGIPIGGDLAVLGTSFGQKTTPAWVYNLEANPAARVSYQGTTLRIVARPARPAEEPIIWANAARVYPGYANYQTRASHRRIRVFVLESI
jgi:deazaflavin-dependent oxidoreductase (nitroreductase family)